MAIAKRNQSEHIVPPQGHIWHIGLRLAEKICACGGGVVSSKCLLSLAPTIVSVWLGFGYAHFLIIY